MVDTEQLGRAVIKQALADAGVGIESGQRVGVNEADRNAARSFLTASSGSWKAAREFWTSLADLDPEKLRTGTMNLLGIEPPPPEPERPPAREEPLRLFHPVPKPEKPPRRFYPMLKPEKSRPREIPSKRRQVLDLLMRPEGVSLDEIIRQFGWKRSTAQTVVSHDVRSYGFRGRLCRDGRYRAFRLNHAVP